MRVATFLYNGYYSLYARVSKKPEFSAWASLTLASFVYLLSVFNVLDGLFLHLTGQPVPYGIQIQIALGVTLAWGSDRNINHTWFGAEKVELPEEILRKARLTASLVLIGSWIAFISTAILVYTPD